MSGAANNPYKQEAPDKTLTQEGVAADAKAVGDALNGLIKKKKLKFESISVPNIGGGPVPYYFSDRNSFADSFPDNATILSAAPSDWTGLTTGMISVFINTEEKYYVIMAQKSGTVERLNLDITYI